MSEHPTAACHAWHISKHKLTMRRCWVREVADNGTALVTFSAYSIGGMVMDGPFFDVPTAHVFLSATKAAKQLAEWAGP